MKIATVAVYVEDQDAALKFWTEQVGFNLHCEESLGPKGRWLEVGPKDQPTCLVLYPKALMEDWAQRKPSVVFECDNLADVHKAMAERGVKFAQEPKRMPWGPFALFLDTEGNQFGLRETQRAPEAVG